MTYPDGVERKLWCETSDEGEARGHLAKLEQLPFGKDIKLERLWERRAFEWRKENL